MNAPIEESDYEVTKEDKNFVYKIIYDKLHKDDSESLPIKDLFISYENEMPKKRSKRIESLIERYDLKLQSALSEYRNCKDNVFDDFILLRSDYDDLLEEIRRIALPDKYLGLMSWLINRCFMMTPNMTSNRDKIQSKLNKNRSLLLKVLYDLNPKTFLKCFIKG